MMGLKIKEHLVLSGMIRDYVATDIYWLLVHFFWILKGKTKVKSFISKFVTGFLSRQNHFSALVKGKYLQQLKGLSFTLGH